MRNDAKRAAAVAMRNRTVRCAGAVRQIAIGLGVAFAMSNAVAAGHAASDGIVRFTGALVDLYDVTLDAPAGVVVEGRAVANGGAAATLRFDAHGRRLPGAQVALVGRRCAVLARCRFARACNVARCARRSKRAAGIGPHVSRRSVWRRDVAGGG